MLNIFLRLIQCTLHVISPVLHNQLQNGLNEPIFTCRSTVAYARPLYTLRGAVLSRTSPTTLSVVEKKCAVKSFRRVPFGIFITSLFLSQFLKPRFD